MTNILFIMPLRIDAHVIIKQQAIVDIIGDKVILPKIYENGRLPIFDIEEAIEKLKNVSLVIADLSFERPSCYFELGMAQALGVPTFLIAESGTALHQHSGNVQFYSGIPEFQQLIIFAVSEHISVTDFG